MACVRVGIRHRLLGRDDRRLRPGLAAVGRRDEGGAGATRREVGRASRLEELEEVVEDARLGIDHDLVTDGLAVLPGIEDRPGARPGFAAVSGLGEPGRASERVSVEGRIRAVARGHEPVPHDVCDACMERIGGNGLLIVEEMGKLEDGAGALVGLDQVRVDPGTAAVARGDSRDTGVVVAAGRPAGAVGRQQTDGVRGPIRPDGDPGIRGPVVRCPGERVQDGPGSAPAEGQRALAPGLTTVGREPGDQALSPAVRPAVLLPHANNVFRIGRIDGNPGFNLSIEVIGTWLASDRTASIGAWAGDSDQVDRASCKGTTGSGHDGQDNQQYREGVRSPSHASGDS